MFALHYHDATKHYFNRFARSLGYLDWATQPDPFRRYDGAPLIELAREPIAGDVPYDALFGSLTNDRHALPINQRTIGEFLRCSMGLSAWKQYQASRWALRVNPSSGNLHPTECYIVWDGRVCHYAPREHALEVRCEIDARAIKGRDGWFLVGLTSIIWREAWKYGERAFRYCQHDVGHAIGALRFAAALLGWRLRLLPWADADVAAVLGVDRDDDFRHAEREEPECIAVVSQHAAGEPLESSETVVAAGHGTWCGRANALSRAHVEWPIIDGVAAATRRQESGIWNHDSGRVRNQAFDSGIGNQGNQPLARQIILQRRSAVAFDGRSMLPAAAFFSMLQHLEPCGSPWDAVDWPPQVHLAMFVHRVEGLVPGIYAYLRDDVLEEWRAAMRPEFLWEKVVANGPNANDPNDPNAKRGLFLLLPMDVKFAGMRVSCDQDIAGDGFFSLGMLARFEPALQERGQWFYRRLFWECGLIGQVLYLEAEAARARGTGIGCFYDDAVHEVLGTEGNTWQSLYHFSMGMPVEDSRLTNEPGYPGSW